MDSSLGGLDDHPDLAWSARLCNLLRASCFCGKQEGFETHDDGHSARATDTSDLLL